MTLTLKILVFVTLTGSVVYAEDSSPVQPQTLTQKDPRGWPYTSARFKNGKKPAEGDHGAYVIIAWAHPPARSKQRGYQIWGDNRIVSQEEVTKAIEQILKKRPLDIIVIGNDWASGSELDGALGELSGRYHVNVLGGSTFGFDNVDFFKESEEVATLVSKAITESSKAQQAGADQPTTAPETKSEGKDKPQPESKVAPK